MDEEDVAPDGAWFSLRTANYKDVAPTALSLECEWAATGTAEVNARALQTFREFSRRPAVAKRLECAWL